MDLIRGDTKRIKFQRRKKDKTVITEKPKEIYFTVKYSYREEEFVIQKKLSDGTIQYDENSNYYTFTISPQDTNDLNYGEYVYDIEVIKGEKDVKTIAKGILTIEEEVTFAKNEV